MIVSTETCSDILKHLLLSQKAQLRNEFENNTSTDKMLSKTQISKTIQSGGFLDSLLSKLADQLMKVAFLWQKLY